MRITNAAIPIHIARAYGIEQAINVSRASGPAQTNLSESATKTQGSTKNLLAGVVPGGVDFLADKPAPSGPALAMYRHPADRNAAATSIDAGRVIDTTA